MFARVCADRLPAVQAGTRTHGDGRATLRLAAGRGDAPPLGVPVPPRPPSVTLAIQAACQLAGRGVGAGQGSPAGASEPLARPPRRCRPGGCAPGAQLCSAASEAAGARPPSPLSPNPNRPAGAHRARCLLRQRLLAPATGTPRAAEDARVAGEAGGSTSPHPPVKLGKALRRAHDLLLI